MGSHPFAKRPASQSSYANRRRSTRVEFETPVILSGRGAGGHPFREETVTTTVSLHGARVRTAMEILIGMQVTVENPRNGKAEKAVCVRIEEPLPGDAAHCVAVQLVRAGNLWGLENPPPDWRLEPAPAIGQTAPPFSSALEQAAETAPPASGTPIIESQAVPWEQQSAALAESVLQILRQQVQALTSNALQEFENRMKRMEAEAGGRLEQRAEEGLADVSHLIESLRSDLAMELMACGAQVVDSAQADLRAKVAEMLAPLMGITATVLPGPRAETLSKK